ncbi:DUF1415 domain-containing protein [Flavihumibacter rivuli]|uniref:DUF1415 domain-containing protein n=1 Tax=Flavihumibacter rivuli TaxID=2838156 RepID=UPI001BDED656|nr:DUF1415 domain-containing protein [Flavihumibacter rivuli]ULQ57189.1 DUF1415 domain-containing protein [Flavihumibacter rivuli]
MTAAATAIEQTKNWIREVVVGCNFCPFANREVKRNSIHYQVEESTELERCLQSFLDECKRLDDDAAVETSLLIFPNAFKDFEEYLDLVDMAEQLLEEEGYEGTYQVASFHPDYRFAGSPEEDAANFTNRSIYPMLHLLREESIEEALDHYAGDPDEIPARNIQFAREKGLAYMKLLRDSCL